MSQLPQLWMRNETRPTERRAPLTPDDAERLVRRGVRITVEESGHRVFPLDAYEAAGCATAPAGSWAGAAPGSAYVLGLKELPPTPERLHHRHVYFGHAYKGQAQAPELLRRFAAGGGTLLDLEYLADAQGRPAGRLRLLGGVRGRRPGRAARARPASRRPSSRCPARNWTGGCAGRGGPGRYAPWSSARAAAADAAPATP